MREEAGEHAQRWPQVPSRSAGPRPWPPWPRCGAGPCLVDGRRRGDERRSSASAVSTHAPRARARGHGRRGPRAPGRALFGESHAALHGPCRGTTPPALLLAIESLARAQEPQRPGADGLPGAEAPPLGCRSRPSPRQSSAAPAVSRGPRGLQPGRARSNPPAGTWGLPRRRAPPRQPGSATRFPRGDDESDDEELLRVGPGRGRERLPLHVACEGRRLCRGSRRVAAGLLPQAVVRATARSPFSPCAELPDRTDCAGRAQPVRIASSAWGTSWLPRDTETQGADLARQQKNAELASVADEQLAAIEKRLPRLTVKLVDAAPDCAVTRDGAALLAASVGNFTPSQINPEAPRHRRQLSRTRQPQRRRHDRGGQSVRRQPMLRRGTSCPGALCRRLPRRDGGIESSSSPEPRARSHARVLPIVVMGHRGGEASCVGLVSALEANPEARLPARKSQSHRASAR